MHTERVLSGFFIPLRRHGPLQHKRQKKKGRVSCVRVFMFARTPASEWDLAWVLMVVYAYTLVWCDCLVDDDGTRRQWWWWYGGNRATFVTTRCHMRLVCSAPADETECDSIEARVAVSGFTNCFLCDRMSVVFLYNNNIVTYMSHWCFLGAN